MTRHVLLEVNVPLPQITEEEFEEAMEDAFEMEQEGGFSVRVLAQFPYSILS